MDKHIKHINRLFLALVLFMLGSQIVIALNADLYMRLPVYIRMCTGQLLLLLPILVYFLITSRKPSNVMRMKNPGGANIALTVVLTYCFLPLLTVVNLISTLIGSAGTEMVAGVLDQFNLVEGLIFIALLPAVIEEFICRGVFYGTYRRNGILTGALLSGFIFGCLHLNINQFSYAFVLGVLAVLVIEATGSIIPAMIMHFTYNANSVLLTKSLGLLGGSDEMMQESMEIAEAIQGPLVYIAAFAIYVPLAIGGTILGWMLLKKMAKMNRRSEHFKVMLRHRTGNRNMTIPYIAAGLICISIMVVLELFGDLYSFALWFMNLLQK